MIIGISGKIGSGKDTVGKIIQYLTMLHSNIPIKKCTFEEFCKSGHGVMQTSKGDMPVYNYWQIKKYAGKLKQIVSILTGISVEDLEKQEVKDKVLGEEWNRKMGGIFEPNNVGGLTEVFKIEEMTVRQLLQEVGTDAMRNVIHSNVWVNALFADYRNSLIKPNNLSSVTDKDFEFYSNHCFNSIFKQDNRPYSIQEFLKNKVPDLTDKMYNDWEKAINNSYPNWIITDCRFPNELQAVKDRGGITIRVNRKNINTVSPIGTPIEVDRAISSLPSTHLSETALDSATFDYVIDNNGTIEELIEKVKQILIKEKII